MEFQGRCLVEGTASAELIHTDVGLSFWGGINPLTSEIQDAHHPLRGQTIGDKILALPSSKGSCTGSMLMLELLLNDCAPAGLIFQEVDQVVTLGVLVGRTLFDRSIPVVVLPSPAFEELGKQKYASIRNGSVHLDNSPLPKAEVEDTPRDEVGRTLKLSDRDQELLTGKHGQAAKVAMKLLLDFAALQDATELIDVTQGHIDACIYTGPASLRYAETILSLGAKFVVPTTLNSISIDRRRWREIGMDEFESAHAGALADAYLAMGATPSFTCAPYSLDTAPKAGENLGWGESNAVVFANSILGARTQKYPDFVDSCIALTGRAPLAGVHRAEGRVPSLVIHFNHLESIDDAFYPLAGYIVGKLSQLRVPLVTGLSDFQPTMADLKAFSAAFGTMSGSPMFHIQGITPEADQYSHLINSLSTLEVTQAHLSECLRALNTAKSPDVQLISLGNPHFLLEEFHHVAELCEHRHRKPGTRVMITTNRHIYEKALAEGYITALESFGASVITDTCWCMLGEPVIGKNVVNIMTNSGKYAHYAPGLVRRGVHFGSLRQCVDAACEGQFYVDGKRDLSLVGKSLDGVPSQAGDSDAGAVNGFHVT